MDDFRFLQDNALWLIIIAIFLLLLFGGSGCNSFFNFDCLGNLFNGCGNSSWIWIIIAVVVIYFLLGDNCGGFLRNDMQ